LTLPVVWLPEAWAELKQALAHYDAIRPEPGTCFLLAVDETVEAISTQPLRFAVVDKDRRRAGVHRFPYGIFFLVEDTRVVVIACFHGKRDPIRWQKR
jgi:toxin ParE1/3/4